MRLAGRDEAPNSVLGKAFAILGAFRHEDRGVTLSELARRTGLAKATVHRLVRELTEHDVIETNDDGRYVLGLRLFEFARLVPIAADLRETALPFIEDLYEATHETVHLGILDGSEVVYLERIAGHRASPIPTRVGGRMPACCTGLGKVMLAHAPQAAVRKVLESPLVPLTPYSITVPSVLEQELRQIAEDGVAYDREEAQIGLVCVAAPVFGPGDRLLAGLSISGPTARAKVESFAPTVRTAARALSRTLRLGPMAGARRA